MTVQRLSEADRRVAFNCLRAAVDGPFFSDYEFHVLFVMERREVRWALPQWVESCNSTPDVAIMLGRALVNLLYATDDQQRKHWSEWITASREEVEGVLNRWKQLQPPVRYSTLSVYGPVHLGGRFHRMISFTTDSGSRTTAAETWRNGEWVWTVEGPGCKEILAAPVADGWMLAQAGVNTDPLPDDYDPLRVPTE